MRTTLGPAKIKMMQHGNSILPETPITVARSTQLWPWTTVELPRSSVGLVSYGHQTVFIAVIESFSKSAVLLEMLHE